MLSDLYPSFLVSGSLYSLGDKTKLSKNDDSSPVSNSSINYTNKPPLGKDRNSSELSNIARQDKGEEEDDSQTGRIPLPLDRSQVTLTSPIVNTRDAPPGKTYNYLDFPDTFLKIHVDNQYFVVTKSLAFSRKDKERFNVEFKPLNVNCVEIKCGSQSSLFYTLIVSISRCQI